MDWTSIELRERQRNMAAVAHREAVRKQQEYQKLGRVTNGITIDPQHQNPQQPAPTNKAPYSEIYSTDVLEKMKQNRSQIQLQLPQSNDTYASNNTTGASLNSSIPKLPLPLPAVAPLPSSTLSDSWTALPPVSYHIPASNETTDSLGLGGMVSNQYFSNNSTGNIQHQTQNNASSNDLRVSLQLYEERLAEERKSRQRLEAEVQQQRSTIIRLTAQSEQIKQFMDSHGQQMHNLSKQLDDQSRSVQQLSREAVAKVKSHDQMLETLGADLTNRQKYWDERRREDGEWQKSIAEQINEIKYRFEHYNMESVNADKELFQRTKELEESWKSMDGMRQQVRDQQMSLESVQREQKASHQALDNKIGTVLLDMRKSMEVEAKQRTSFEENMENLFQGLREMVNGQEKEMMRRFNSTKESIQSHLLKELQSIDGRVLENSSLLNTLEAKVRDRIAAYETKFDEQFTGIRELLSEEIKNREHFDKQVRRDVEMAAKSLGGQQQHIAETFEKALAKSMAELGREFSKLKDSHAILDADYQSKVRLLETNLRSEIKGRMELEPKLKSFVNAAVGKLQESMAMEAENRNLNFVSSMESLTRKFEREAEQHIQKAFQSLKANEIGLLDNQMSAMRKSLDDQQHETTARFHTLIAKVEQMQAENEIRDRSLDRAANNPSPTQQSLEVQDKLNGHQLRLEHKLEALRTSVDDRLAIRQQQWDTAMTALMSDVQQRLTRAEFDTEKQQVMIDADVKHKQLKERISQIQSNYESTVQQNTENNHQVHVRLKEAAMHFERLEAVIVELRSREQQQDHRVDLITQNNLPMINTLLTENRERVLQVKKEVAEQLQPRLERLNQELSEVKQQLTRTVQVQKFNAELEAQQQRAQDTGGRLEDQESQLKQLRLRVDKQEQLFTDKLLSQQSAATTGANEATNTNNASSNSADAPSVDSISIIKSWKDGLQTRLLAVEDRLRLLVGDKANEDIRFNYVDVRDEETRRLIRNELRQELRLVEEQLRLCKSEIDLMKHQENGVEQRLQTSTKQLDRRIDQLLLFQRDCQSQIDILLASRANTIQKPVTNSKSPNATSAGADTELDADESEGGPAAGIAKIFHQAAERVNTTSEGYQPPRTAATGARSAAAVRFRDSAEDGQPQHQRRRSSAFQSISRFGTSDNYSPGRRPDNAPGTGMTEAPAGRMTIKSVAFGSDHGGSLEHVTSMSLDADLDADQMDDDFAQDDVEVKADSPVAKLSAEGASAEEQLKPLTVSQMSSPIDIGPEQEDTQAGTQEETQEEKANAEASNIKDPEIVTQGEIAQDEVAELESPDATDMPRMLENEQSSQQHPNDDVTLLEEGAGDDTQSAVLHSFTPISPKTAVPANEDEVVAEKQEELPVSTDNEEQQEQEQESSRNQNGNELDENEEYAGVAVGAAETQGDEEYANNNSDTKDNQDDAYGYDESFEDADVVDEGATSRQEHQQEYPEEEQQSAKIPAKSSDSIDSHEILERSTKVLRSNQHVLEGSSHKLAAEHSSTSEVKTSRRSQPLFGTSDYSDETETGALKSGASSNNFTAALKERMKSPSQITGSASVIRSDRDATPLEKHQQGKTSLWMGSRSKAQLKDSKAEMSYSHGSIGRSKSNLPFENKSTLSIEGNQIPKQGVRSTDSLALPTSSSIPNNLQHAKSQGLSYGGLGNSKEHGSYLEIYKSKRELDTLHHQEHLKTQEHLREQQKHIDAVSGSRAELNSRPRTTKLSQSRQSLVKSRSGGRNDEL